MAATTSVLTWRFFLATGLAGFGAGGALTHLVGARADDVPVSFAALGLSGIALAARVAFAVLDGRHKRRRALAEGRAPGSPS